jgi:hypothetical protein
VEVLVDVVKVPGSQSQSCPLRAVATAQSLQPIARLILEVAGREEFLIDAFSDFVDILEEFLELARRRV